MNYCERHPFAETVTGMMWFDTYHIQITDFCVAGVFFPCTSGTDRLFVLSDEELVLRGEIGVVDDLAMGVFFDPVSTKGGIDYFCPMYPPS